MSIKQKLKRRSFIMKKLLLIFCWISCLVLLSGCVGSADNNISELPTEHSEELLHPSEPESEENEIPPTVEAEPGAVKLDEIPYETYSLDSNASYTSDIITAGTLVEFPEGTDDYTYYCCIHNLSDEEIEVYPTISVHAYIGNGEWVGISFGEEDSLEVYIIPAKSEFALQYFPHELPEGTYRAVMHYVTASGEKGYFSFEY